MRNSTQSNKLTTTQNFRLRILRVSREFRTRGHDNGVIDLSNYFRGAKMTIRYAGVAQKY